MNADVVNVLFDENNKNNLILDNGEGVTVSFEQVFAIVQSGVAYCILRPLDKVEGLTAQSALAFWVDEDGTFRVVKDKKLSDRLFSEYYNAVKGAKDGEKA